MSAEAYPLYWPEGWKRTLNPELSRFKTGFGAARVKLSAEIQRMGGTGVIISTNVPLRNDGMPRASAPEPRDAGVAVYFRYKGKDMVFACDKFRYSRENIYAIAMTIDALRGIERWGASDMMERAFSGFKALESSTGREWWQVLNVSQNSSKEIIDASFRVMLRKCHPDAGGSHEAMTELNQARDKAMRYIDSK